MHLDPGFAIEQIAGQPRGDDPGAIIELAGIALARAISSFTVCGPSCARTLSSEVFFDASVIGAKSLSGSYGRFLVVMGLSTMVTSITANKV